MRTLTGHGRPATGCWSGTLAWPLLLCQTVLLFCLAECYQTERRGPTFVHEPPRRVDFSNSTGATVACAATGSPEPRISWTAADGSPVEDVRGLRYARPNGSLVLPPFRAEDYRQDVHATVYRCAASNPVGAVVSRDVHVRAAGSDGRQAGMEAQRRNAGHRGKGTHARGIAEEWRRPDIQREGNKATTGGASSRQESRTSRHEG